MYEVSELKLSLSRMETATRDRELLGLTFCTFILFVACQAVVTDRIQVTDEAVRVENIGK